MSEFKRAYLMRHKKNIFKKRKKEHCRRSYKAKLNSFSRKLTRLFERGRINLREAFDRDIVNIRFYSRNRIKTHKFVKDDH
jgi:hypothetical protein